MLWLSQHEVDNICEPLLQAAAQIRFLRGMGLRVEKKPNGSPIVMRASLDALAWIGAQDPKRVVSVHTEPDARALAAFLATTKRKKN